MGTCRVFKQLPCVQAIRIILKVCEEYDMQALVDYELIAEQFRFFRVRAGDDLRVIRALYQCVGRKALQAGFNL